MAKKNENSTTESRVAGGVFPATVKEGTIGAGALRQLLKGVDQMVLCHFGANEDGRTTLTLSNPMTGQPVAFPEITEE